ncbi:helix-turn-helix transcriptional regulator [Ellagibacter isourolithinifaciens]|uniref:helix-turn-helix transcriptional regulator n=1 Tax=Ellagibacter isourolithinifaciens TaxID=2137581 RepID=UPI003A957109
MLDGRPPARIAKSTASQLTTDDERKDRAAGAPEGDFPAEPPTAFPEKPATVAECTHSEGGVGRHDSGQPDGSGRGAESRSDDPALQADVPRGRGRRNFEGDFELTDRLSKQAQVLREQYRLSARETEVMEYIARGYTVARTAEELIVSENAIRTHSKRIYAKLDVHKKQELIDMLKAVEL